MWKPLKLAMQEDRTAPLLVKREFGPSNYAIYLTDLTHLWSESLDRKQIIRKALELNTSIDPSEDASQMQLFLRHVKEALEGASQTFVRLTGMDDSNKLLLNISVILPSPLPLLEWPIDTTRMSQESFTCHVMLPSLGQTWSLRAQVISLLDNLREKDNVIQKLTDRMQSDGTDFSKIFPSAASVKSRSRVDAKDAAAKVVKGLAVFNECEWQERLSENSSAPTSIYDLITAIFPLVDDVAQKSIQHLESQIRWSQLLQRDSPQNADIRNAPLPHTKPQQTAPLHKADSSIDNCFQVILIPLLACYDRRYLQAEKRQISPPHENPSEIVHRGPKQLSQPNITEQNPSDSGDSTTADSEDEKVVQAKPQLSKAEKLPPSEDKPMSPDEYRKTAAARAPEKHEPRSPTRSASENETEDDQDSYDDTTHQATISVSNVPAAKPKLGTIGNRNRKLIRSSNEKSSNDEDHPKLDTAAKDVNYTNNAATRKPKHRLGKIGSRAKAGTPNDKQPLSQEHHSPGLQKGNDLPSEDDGGCVQASSPLQPSVPTKNRWDQGKQQPLGTISEIQANENRERLKRELEIKSKAASKKKRKF